MPHITHDTALTCDEQYDVEEYCSNCDNYIAVTVDRACPHLETVCPVCGEKLMLCSMCDIEHGCDWTPENGCRMDKDHKEV